jgi:hypothetical protein
MMGRGTPREPNSEATMITRTSILSALAVAAAVTALFATGSAVAGSHGGMSKGGNPVKNPANPIVNTIHPIIEHGPLHGVGSSHNPIVVTTGKCKHPNVC